MLDYQTILNEVRQLEVEDQLRLLESIAENLRASMPAKKTHSILELKGLGREIWSGIDAQQYVDQERDAWSG